MDAEEIRAEAIELIERAEFEGWKRGEPWRAEQAVDALAAAGFLPVAQEGRYIGRGMRRRTRFVGAWQEPAE
ncbi:hypothetical protein [Nocardia flavorosea]|uniref:Uncharacterized protein n=1 Tax=Nocardia flavorosea TaxID=53429 RepID=A0A846YSJ2_9NOCA|nr:hypothetical protein [Nocardia flavorosea]NKY60454.1 hypothetical protein [Nocardia flavorosea]